MAKEKKKAPAAQPEQAPEGPALPEEQTEEESAAPEAEEAAGGQTDPLQLQLDAAREALAALEDKYLRLAAEYDNFRSRTAKEREALWTDVKVSTAAAFLSVYDNLERALKQETPDAAYKKGVEMTMTGFQDVLVKLGVEKIPALGETFDPNLHNAVMHVEDADAEENTVVEVFQQGFRLGEKVLRFAVVKVAN